MLVNDKNRKCSRQLLTTLQKVMTYIEENIAIVIMTAIENSLIQRSNTLIFPFCEVRTILITLTVILIVITIEVIILKYVPKDVRIMQINAIVLMKISYKTI